MTNKNNTVLYTGITNNLKRRVYEHKEKIIGGFTKKYEINKLVYYEVHDDAYSAIAREKKIKGGSRLKKVLLVSEMILAGKTFMINYEIASLPAALRSRLRLTRNDRERVE